MKKSFVGGFLISCGLLLGGCFGGESAPSSFYILSAGADNVAVSQTKTSVGVYPVQVPLFLDRPQIVVNETATELILSETNRWSEPLSQVTQRALVANLQQFLPQASVQSKGYDDSVFQRLVRADIFSMTGELGKEARLSVWWTLTNATGKELYRERFEDKVDCGQSYAEYVDAQNELWRRFAHRIALQIR